MHTMRLWGERWHWWLLRTPEWLLSSDHSKSRCVNVESNRHQFDLPRTTLELSFFVSLLLIQQGRLDLLWLRNKAFWRSRYAADLFGPRYCFTTLWLLNCCWLTLTFQWLAIKARQRAHILIGALPIRSKSQESKMNGTTEVAALQNLPQSTSPSFCKNLFASRQSNSSLCKTST